MPVKIRLQRHGKKGKPFYWIVAADARSKRDGKYLEKLGTYNPNFNPAQIELDIDGTVKWLQNGAQPTDTAKSILSYRGAMLKNHLIGGVRKGALTEEQAEAKFQAWLDEKNAKIDAKKSDLVKAKEAEAEKQLEAEKATNEARIAAAAPVVEEATEEVAEEAAPVAEEATEEVVAEETAPIAEEATEEVVAEEAAPVAEEAAEEVVAEEAAPVVEEATEEVVAEETAPVAEEATEEVVAEETAPVAEEATEEVVAEEEAPAAEEE
jgi:small subunit ribosomal protein S16